MNASVKFTFKKGILNLSTSGSEFGEADDSIEFDFTGKELTIGLYGWYAIYPSIELKKNKPHYFSLFDVPLLLFRDDRNNVRCIKNICPHRGASFYGGSITNGNYVGKWTCAS